MKKKTSKKRKEIYPIILAVVIVFVVVFAFFLVLILSSMKDVLPTTEGEADESDEVSAGNECVIDSDCIAIGQQGDCNCGCYGINEEIPETKPGCKCAAPISCECINGYCMGIY
jgi:hypothetical protein